MKRTPCYLLLTFISKPNNGIHVHRKFTNSPKNSAFLQEHTIFTYINDTRLMFIIKSQSHQYQNRSQNMSNQAFLLYLMLFSTISTSYAYPQPSPSNETQKPKELVTSEPSKKLIEMVVVEGIVYYQSCSKAGTWSLEGAKPLSAAKVGIACKDHKNRVSFYKVFQANSNGYYYAPIQGILGPKGYNKKKEIDACSVYLLSSPDSSCNILTNINSGIAGAKLGEGKKVIKGKRYEVMVYAAPPLAFRSADCPPNNHY